MAIKLRSVYTGKFHFSAYGQTACSAHTGSVYHNRVHADNGWNLQLLSQLADKFHHNHRSDGNTNVIVFSLILYQILNHTGYHAFSLIRTIVCGNIKISCYLTHLILQNQKILCLGTYNDICLNAMLFHPLYLRIYRRCSHTACHKQIFAFFYFLQIILYKLRWLSQRSYKILEGISGLQSGHSQSRSTYNLEYNGNGSLFPVIIADCQRNPFSLLIYFDNYKLSRLTGSGHTRGLHIHQKNLISQLFCFQNSVHIDPPMFCCCKIFYHVF